MHTNLIRAIINIVNNPVIKLKTYTKGSNRINNVGDSLEEYIKDMFASTMFENDENIRNHKISECFSYTGNKNNPPDIIIKRGDAIEVKKIENITADLALNSSYPKSKLYSDSDRIQMLSKLAEFRKRDQEQLRLLAYRYILKDKFPQQSNTLLDLLRFCFICTAQNNRAGIFDLVAEELAEILSVDPALCYIHDRREAVELRINLFLHALYRLDHVGKLAHARRLDQDAVRVIGVHHLAQGFPEISYK